MDWSNETYVRLYTRDTPTWLKMRWQGECLLMQLLRKVDRSGRLDGITDPVDDLALVTGLPENVVEKGLEKLRKYEVVELNDGILIIPNYMEAQTASKSDKQRQRESRENRRTAAIKPKKARKKPVKKEFADEQFDQIMGIWPKKTKRKESKLSFQKALEKVSFEDILKSVSIAVKIPDWSKERSKFCPRLCDWLDDERWNEKINLSEQSQSNLRGFPGERLTAAEQQSRRNQAAIDAFRNGE